MTVLECSTQCGPRGVALRSGAVCCDLYPEAGRVFEVCGGHDSVPGDFGRRLDAVEAGLALA